VVEESLKVEESGEVGVKGKKEKKSKRVKREELFEGEGR